MTSQAQLPCGHTVTITDAAQRAIDKSAEVSLAETGRAVASLRCPRCGKVGVPVKPGTAAARSPIMDMLTNPKRASAAVPTAPRRSGEPRPAPAPAPAPAPVPEPPAPPAPTPAPEAPPAPAPAPSGGERVVIAGGPNTGKTTLADKIGRPNTQHTDDLIGTYDWSGVSAHVAESWMAQPGPWVIEGVATVRALRKRMEATADAPCDVLIWLTVAHESLTPGQDRMSKGCHTVYDEILPQLEARGVTVVVDP